SKTSSAAGDAADAPAADGNDLPRDYEAVERPCRAERAPDGRRRDRAWRHRVVTWRPAAANTHPILATIAAPAGRALRRARAPNTARLAIMTAQSSQPVTRKNRWRRSTQRCIVYGPVSHAGARRHRDDDSAPLVA